MSLDINKIIFESLDQTINAIHESAPATLMEAETQRQEAAPAQPIQEGYALGNPRCLLESMIPAVTTSIGAGLGALALRNRMRVVALGE